MIFLKTYDVYLFVERCLNAKNNPDTNSSAAILAVRILDVILSPAAGKTFVTLVHLMV